MNAKDPNPSPEMDRTTSIGGNTDLDVTSDLSDPSRPPADLPRTPPISLSGGSDSGSGGAAGSATGGRSGRALMQLGQYALLGSPDGKSSQPVHGGEGCVYLAQRLDGGPKVALKTPLPKYADRPQRCKRLIKEAQHLQSMDHPAIVKVFDIVADHDPPFYTMTCLPNGSLAERLEEGNPMGHDEVLRISVPLAGAVQYVHEKKGVSHRDIKPQNVMMDENDQPVFVDFGLSRDNTGDQASIVDPESDASASRFKVGTLLYMAPELFEGKAGNSQTDIYAFGVMLYVMATGQRPYDGRDFDTLSVQKRLADPVEPLEAHPDLDPRLAQVIAHATARRAKDRYATMEDLHEDLRSVRDGKIPVHADAALLGPEASKPPKASSGGLAKFAVAAVLVLAAAGGSYYYFDQLQGTQAETPSAQGNQASLFASAEDTETQPEVSASNTSPAENEPPAAAEPNEPAVEPAAVAIEPNSPSPDAQSGNALSTSMPKPEQAEPVVSIGAQEPGTPIVSLFDDPDEPAIQTPASEPAPATHTTDTTAPDSPQVRALVEQVTARLNGDPALDSKTVEALNDLAEATTDTSRAELRGTYRGWLHDAAKFGATESLAWLIENGQAFDVTANAENDAGHHWLQTAVRSPENKAFAASLTTWMKTHEIDPKILTAHAIGTDAPLTMAQDFGRTEWVEALRAAAAEFGIDLDD